MGLSQWLLNYANIAVGKPKGWTVHHVYNLPGKQTKAIKEVEGLNKTESVRSLFQTKIFIKTHNL